MSTTATTPELLSIGKLAYSLQRSTSDIKAAADKLKVAPAMRINHVAYYDHAGTEKLVRHFREGK